MNTVTTQIRVRYAETDMSGIAYNANYLIWFEQARGEFFWQQGMDYARDIEARGYHWPVVEAKLRYHAPAYYGDLLTARAWIGELKSRSVQIRYEISRNDKKLCTGFTTHINIDNQGRPVPFPEDIKRLISQDK